MAQYTITTTRQQEIDLKFSYDQFGAEGQTQQQFFQQRINVGVLAPMGDFRIQQQTTNLTASIETVPESNEDAFNADLEALIIEHGGTIVTGPPPGPPVPGAFAGPTGGAISTLGQQGSPNIQTRPTNQATPNTSRPDGGGDNSA